MIYLSYFVCCGDYIIHEKGGHCFFSLKSDVNLGTIRFYIKRKVVNLTLPFKLRRNFYEGNMELGTSCPCCLRWFSGF